MSRAATIDLLVNSSVLQDLGIDEDRIFSNFAMDVAPHTGMWIIIRWGSKPGRWGHQGGASSVTFWVYALKRETTDYTNINDAINEIAKLMESAEHVEGSDGYTITCTRYEGESEDLTDSGYNAIARNLTMTMVCRPT